MFKTTFNTIIITALLLVIISWYPSLYFRNLGLNDYSINGHTFIYIVQCSGGSTMKLPKLKHSWPLFSEGPLKQPFLNEWIFQHIQWSVCWMFLLYCCWFLRGPITVQTSGSQKCRSTTGYASIVFNFRINLKGPPLI